MTDQKKETRKFLFISHHASRSGAPFLLLYLLQRLRRWTQYSFDVLLLEDGPLREDFKKVSDRLFLLPELLNSQPGIGQRIKKKFKFPVRIGNDLEKVTSQISLGDYTLVYGNTIVSLSWLIGFKRVAEIKTICAIHELSYALEVFHNAVELRTLLPQLDMIVPGSEVVARNLIDRYGIPESMIRVIPSFIEVPPLISAEGPELESLGIPVNRFIIGGAGMAEWRKGTDLIVPLAQILKKRYPAFEFHLIWIGSRKNDDFTIRLQFDIEKAGVQDRITLVETTPYPLNYINQFDVFAMLSREDPFPLVSLEAGYLEKPVIMFKGTGGTAQILKNGGGVEVAYLDLEAFSQTLWELYQDEGLRHRMGRILKEEIVEKYTADIVCLKAVTILENMS